ncbi:hypothetical genomic island protein [Bartonella henselae str. Houston-1]|uniref:Hypothetical genomic island protein n=1 Tax=Bartonella henselae (strain ATCC 49882 / DSM 28221 / CCUG 30454 / Houston 1) TaxID=283166 RepID=A0A0H3M342_BARHE|nr:hypothetical genomic island protein [Bartonella henselae str. Houston-1]
MVRISMATTWAFLDEKIINLCLKRENFCQMPIGRKENICWLIDFVAPYGYVVCIIHNMQWYVFLHQYYCYAIRRNQDGGIRKIACWCCYRAQNPSEELL